MSSKKKTYKCKYCGKGGFKSAMAIAGHTMWCKKRPTNTIQERVKRKYTKRKTNSKVTITGSNIQFVPLALALDFSNQTFEIISQAEMLERSQATK